MSPDRAKALEAFLRLLDAMRLRGEGGCVALALAFAPGAVVQRHGPGPTDAPVELISGSKELRRWLAMTRDPVRFSVRRASVAVEAGWASIRYGVRVGNYFNGGVWRARLSPSGRIAELVHLPDGLPEKWSAP